MNGPRYLMRWNDAGDQRVHRDVLLTTHRLGELAQFSATGITELIDRHDRSRLFLATMGDNPAHPNQWRRGSTTNHDGKAMLEFIQRGRLQLSLQNLQANPTIRRIALRLIEELVECQPGLRASHAASELAISSATASQYYRFHIRPTTLWHLRGRQRVWIYPAGEPFVARQTLEQAIQQGLTAAPYFEPAFDDQSGIIDLEPGQMLALPQYTPYRTANLDGTNVTLRTDYVTGQTIRQNEIHLANRLLSKYLPTPLSSRTEGCLALAKRWLSRLIGYRLIQRRSPAADGEAVSDWALDQAQETFYLDNTAPDGIRFLQPPLAQRATLAAPVSQTSVNLSPVAVLEH
ncbi:MAG: hypothetical protein MI861_27655 [Pirellulales bacterium]|nr:hypothetical protein [Pirellulales bacterium]